MKLIHVIPTVLVAFFCNSLLHGDTISTVQEHIKNGNFIEAKNSLSYIITEDSSNPPLSIPNSESILEQDIPLPTSAYSLRKLVLDYSGYILRIRRSGDNLEANVSFDADNKLSINSPVTIVGGNNDSYNYDDIKDFIHGHDAYVHTWYNQAGTDNAVQENYEKQPKISENGTLLADGIDFDGADDFLNSSGVLTSNASASIFAKVKALSSDASGSDWFYTEGYSSTGQFFGIGISESGHIGDSSASTNVSRNDGRGSSLTNSGLISLIASTSTTASYLNGVQLGSISTPTNNNGNHTITSSGGIGGHSPSSSLSNFSIEEIIIYNTDQTENRFQIESNINNYYGLFKYNDEALIHKFINDIGYYYENTYPDYLVSNWNFKPGKTQTAYDYNHAIPRESAKSIELVVESDVLGAWEYYDDQPFPLVENGMGIRSQYRLFSIYNWDMRRKTNSKFSYNDAESGYYYAKLNGASISFEFDPADNVAKQVNFNLQGGDTGYLQVFINGTSIAEVYSNTNIYLYKENLNIWNLQNTLPLVLLPGDIVTFKSVINDWEYPIDNDIDITIGSAIKPSPSATHEFKIPENGVGYTRTYPNFGDSKTIGDILATVTQQDLPARKLLRSLINTLSLISDEANVTLPTSFTEANYDIIIRYEDAMMLKSLLELYDAFLSIAGQYNLDIPYDYDTLVDFGPYKTFKAFFSDFPNALEGLEDRLSDQADTKAKTLNALTKLEEVLPVMSDRGSLDSDSNDINTDLLYSSYLFTISDNTENEDLTDLLAQISAIKTSLNGYINPSALTLNSDEGYNISLEPFVTENPFPIKNFIKDIEKDPILSWISYEGADENSEEMVRIFELMEKYGLVKDYLPMSLEENILIFKDENGEIIKTIMNNDDDEDYSSYGGIDYSGSSGKLYAEIFDFQESGENDFFKLKYESDGTISWSYNKTDAPAITGEFLYYKASLDLNNNGKSDGVDIDNIGYEEHGLFKTTSLNYTSPLNSSLIQSAEDERIQAAPNNIMGMIFIFKEGDHDDPEYYDYTSNLLWPYEVAYYISKYDSIELDARDYESTSNSSYRKWSEYNYSNGVILKDIWAHYDDPTVLHFLTSYSGYYHDDGEEEKFVCYPGYLDMDNDGVSDASEIVAGIIPYFIDYPSYTEIQYAIDAYEYNNNNSEGIGNNINVNTNALEDLDNDNMPDALELKFGGNPSNSNDAQTSLDAVMSTESYSLDEIIELRLGSTLYQVSEGLASFNIILEESTDLTTWTPYGEYSMVLSDDGNSDIKFFRFKMAD